MIYRYLYIILVLVGLNSCANEIPPTGGPEDVKPPELLSTNPDSTNNIKFYHNEVEFIFDEWIEANSFKKNTIITPDPGEYKYRIKKRTLTIEFLNTLRPQTTYKIILNNAVRDITKKNEIGNIELAFSTGDYIDSLSITGQVKMLLTHGNVEKALVGLYKKTDTLDITDQKPDYFTYTNKDGRFQINYLKPDVYEIYSFLDKNNNQKLNINKEYVGFVTHHIDLEEDTSIQLSLNKQDTSHAHFLYTKAIGNIHELHFDKGIEQFSSKESFSYDLTEDGKVVKLFTTFEQDSIPYIFSYIDSSSQSNTDTTILIKPRKKEVTALVESIFIHNRVKKVDDTLRIDIQLNEPVESILKDSIRILSDSNALSTTTSNISWNATKTRLHITKPYLGPIDTVQVEIKDSAFTSIYNTVSAAKSLSRILQESSVYGTINGTVNTSRESYKIQLLDKHFLLVQELAFGSQKEFSFQELTPGEYNIRVLIDSDHNNQHSDGNISTRKLPEPVYIFPEAIMIRQNWEITDINLQF